VLALIDVRLIDHILGGVLSVTDEEKLKGYPEIPAIGIEIAAAPRW
jgi:hypothetical protein